MILYFTLRKYFSNEFPLDCFYIWCGKYLVLFSPTLSVLRVFSNELSCLHDLNTNLKINSTINHWSVSGLSSYSFWRKTKSLLCGIAIDACFFRHIDLFQDSFLLFWDFAFLCLLFSSYRSLSFIPKEASSHQLYFLSLRLIYHKQQIKRSDHSSTTTTTTQTKCGYDLCRAWACK